MEEDIADHPPFRNDGLVGWPDHDQITVERTAAGWRSGPPAESRPVRHLAAKLDDRPLTTALDEVDTEDCART